MADQGQRTEQPTPRRIEKAREEGRFAVSQPFVSAIQFLGVAAMAGSFALEGVWLLRGLTRWLAGLAFRIELNPAQAVQVVRESLSRALLPLVGAGAGLVALTLLAQLAMTKMGFSGSRLAPDLKRLSPLARLKDLARQNLPNLAQALVLVPLFGLAVYYIASDNFSAYLRLPLMGLEAGMREIGSSLKTLLWRAALLFVVFGAVDLYRQRRRYQKDLRMTKQEVRDEMKEIEGNPEIKMRIRRLRRDLLRRRMMQEVPKATAVVVNPTHYAVAIRYRMEALGAPLVVAKGKNYLALRIRQLAVENQVPVVENPPLAQALYASVEVGQEIPAHLYRAVAEILAYIYKLMGGRLPNAEVRS